NAVTVDMTRVSGGTARAHWYNPRTGDATFINDYSTFGTRTFTPPDANDWVLVLDDTSAAFAAPGAFLLA
ncbi:MAG TPA: putative collagen-binding domain-containing protein, partial [Vicinamibacterales bacterium]